MLVLTRKKNDTIIIDGRITVQVLQVKGGGIRLGITAPAEVSILRGELKPFGVEGDEREPVLDQVTLPFEGGLSHDLFSAMDASSDAAASQPGAADFESSASTEPDLKHSPLADHLSRARRVEGTRSRLPARWRRA